MDSFEQALRRHASRKTTSNSDRRPSKSQAVHVCIDPYTLEETEKGSNSICFDSRLEATVFRFLSRYFAPNEIEAQKSVDIYYDVDTDIELKWKADFYIKPKDFYLEVKGGWINNASAKAEKSLFVWQYALAKQKVQRLLVCSDEQFKISKIQVHDYVSAVKQILES